MRDKLYFKMLNDGHFPFANSLAGNTISNWIVGDLQHIKGIREWISDLEWISKRSFVKVDFGSGNAFSVCTSDKWAYIKCDFSETEVVLLEIDDLIDLLRKYIISIGENEVPFEFEFEYDCSGTFAKEKFDRILG